ncbi:MULTISPECIES: CCA tRNA nucleotidyltransferase [Asticcacaulis]|uniref:CCA tRNA nucleotidyltransferase n=1 Tax=Asticcacaulis TaxID=76890 RepID=UPI001AE316BB|nr:MULTISPECIES: CCA tRNA nucleotidyltransferase [Asticcacaulis]MBP2158657.1 poly(A) polymerase [Asticcacaulis solisilvae]MDR6799703.1 poly(A) polymerase [Asticcacaulis sp. BE141]
MTRIELSGAMQAPATRAVFAALEARGGKGCVRFVGGCVRNALMGRPISDLDLSTQLLPDETEAALEAAGIRNVPTGKAFGTITAVVDGEPYEITSLREDVETDGRRAVVSYTTDWAKDAERRDFYLNALYADIEGTISDPTGFGLDDARAGRVRFIGAPEQRIREDYLRILRFFRFTAGYAMDIDEASLKACAALKAGIDGLSGERIWQEVCKTLAVGNPLPAFEAMSREGILLHVLPGWQHTAGKLPELSAMIASTPDVVRRFMALLDGGIGLDLAHLTPLRERLKFSNATFDRLYAAGVATARLADADEGLLKRLIYSLGREAVEDAVCLIAAHLGRSPDAMLGHLGHLHVPDFPLKGADLIARGLKPGPELGQRLKQIETEWLNHDFSQSVIEDALDAIGKRPM